MMTETTTTNTTTNPQAQEHVTDANPPARRRGSPNVVVLALFVGLLGGLLIRAGTGCAPTEEAAAPDAEGDTHGEHDEHDHDHGDHDHGDHDHGDHDHGDHDHGDHDHGDHDHGHHNHSHHDHEPGDVEIPEGVTRLGNEGCPVMDDTAHDAFGVEYNGWWIALCCDGCQDDFEADPEAFVEALKDETGIDVSHSPEQTAKPVENETCPVMGDEADEAYTTEYNGWRIRFCCPGCDSFFHEEPEAYTARLLEETGIDVRLTPEEAEQAAAWPDGPNGTRDLQNERDPVTGEPTRASVGVEVGGWWVRLASPDSVRPFVDNLERYAGELAVAAGIDVRHGPDAQPQRQSHAEHEAHADDEPATSEEESDVVIDLANELCPVMGDDVEEGEYTVYNGYRIQFCCPGCDRFFREDVDRYADGLKEQTGHDVRVPAE